MAPENRRQSLAERLKENAAMLREILSLISTHKKWWLLPIFAILSLLSTFLVLAGGHSILPAIYALF